MKKYFIMYIIESKYFYILIYILKIYINFIENKNYTNY